MDRMNAGGRAFTAAETGAETEAIEFVRFCHRRRRVGWPELYDEMCAVAGRGLYRGYGPDELATIGIGLGLFQMPAMAGLAAVVVAEDQERRREAADIRISLIAAEDSRGVGQSLEIVAGTTTPVGIGASQPSPAAPAAPAAPIEPEPTDVGGPVHGSIRVAVAAGA